MVGNAPDCRAALGWYVDGPQRARRDTLCLQDILRDLWGIS